LFPLADAPKTLQMIASVDPLSYGVDGLRSVLIGVTHFGVATDLVILSAFTTVFLSIGGYLFSKIQL
jgi:ABC-2 type transport system permease protein